VLSGGEMAAGMRVLETADASKKVQHPAAEEAEVLPDTVTAGEASVTLDPAPSRKAGERERLA